MVAVCLSLVCLLNCILLLVLLSEIYLCLTTCLCEAVSQMMYSVDQSVELFAGVTHCWFIVKLVPHLNP